MEFVEQLPGDFAHCRLEQPIAHLRLLTKAANLADKCSGGLSHAAFHTIGRHRPLPRCFLKAPFRGAIRRACQMPARLSLIEVNGGFGDMIMKSPGLCIALLAEARPDAPKLIQVCRSRYPSFGDRISTHIPASVREQARHLKRARAFASLQDLYLEAILKSLTRRGVLGPDLQPITPYPAPRFGGLS